jgi:hypothetical protein
MPSEVVRAAARRLAVIAGAVIGGTAVVALLIGLAAGASVGRALSLGWYLGGSALLIGGFFVGNRGPARPQGDAWNPLSMQRWTRWASPEEQRESISFSALLVILGLVLIVLGAVVDSRHGVI